MKLNCELFSTINDEYIKGCMIQFESYVFISALMIHLPYSLLSVYPHPHCIGNSYQIPTYK